MGEKLKLNQLTSLRFFAAIIVLLGHSSEYQPYSVLNFLPISRSQAVSLFFVLSGFILSYAYRDYDFSTGKFKFLAMRLCRVFPVHIVTLFLFIALFIGTIEARDWTLSALLANITLIQSFIPFQEYFFSFNGVSWSISTEMFFYLIFPFVFLLQKRYKLAMLSLCVIFPAVMIVVCIVLSVPPNSTDGLSMTGLIYVNPLARLSEFIIGMITYRLITDAPIKCRSNIAASVLQISSIILVCAAFSILYWVAAFFPGDAMYPIRLYLVSCGTGVFFALMICTLALNEGIVAKLLDNKVLVLFGEISFSIYMTHQIILRYMSSNFMEFMVSSPIYSFIIFVMTTTCLSYVLYKYIETPSRTAAKRFFDSRKNVNKIVRADKCDIP